MSASPAPTSGVPRAGRHAQWTVTDVPSEVTVVPLFVEATKRGVPGGFTMVFNRVFEAGYWARLADVERAVYPAIGFVARFDDDFRAEVALSELMALTGLGRTSVKKGVAGLIDRGLLRQERAGSGRTKAVYQLLVPVKEAGASHQPDAAQDRRRAKARDRQGAAAATPTVPPSRPGAGHDRGGVDAAVADPSPSPSRPGDERGGGKIGGSRPYVRETSEADQPPEAAATLRSLGVAAAVAADLAGSFDVGHVAAYCEAYRRNRAEGRRYAPGWLVNAIREGWPVKHLRPPVEAKPATPAPPADPFEAAWREAGELDESAFESHRAAVVAAAEPGMRAKLIEADRDSAILRSAVAERLMDASR